MSNRINPYRLFVGSFMPNWLLSRPEISTNAKVVYARLAQYAGKDGEAFPLMQTLADEVGMQLKTVQRALDELKEHRLIESEQRGFGQSNIYFFLRHPWMKSECPTRKDTRVQPERTPVSKQERTPVSKHIIGVRESSKENHLRDPSTFFGLYDKWEKEAATDPRSVLSEMVAFAGGGGAKP